MTIKLYGAGQSRSFRCLWALYEANIEHEFIALTTGDNAMNGMQSPDYLKINSQGKIPSLVNGDFTLTESAAILNYIDTLASASFIPHDARQRARYDELCSFILTELEQPLWSNGKHRFAIPKEHRVPDMLKTASWEFQKAQTALSGLITIDKFALGNEFTFADVLLAQTFDWAERFEFEVSAKHLDYRNRMYSRDAVKSALAQLS